MAKKNFTEEILGNKTTNEMNKNFLCENVIAIIKHFHMLKTISRYTYLQINIFR